ncbi:UDP-3-O-(3-hydroxymyristoyl)glucosamine N-acyltransferase [Calidithermus chliarophilus]|uniref:UDP-3-O-(3-hydroxymyristoyl)glucosamine N-acyltransferase n=1 Tax=Calidithermus chliarophilus TaxID=52023 RepID=UPI00041BAF55|nr:UDP-3-O-(3-hydroxymyristoyl)glucosamine N-acyltransferase [Calidithermus chliarophilus]
MRLSDVAHALEGRLEGPDLEVSRLAPPETARPGELVAVREPKFLPQALQSGAALVLPDGLPLPEARSAVRVASLGAAWPRLLALFEPAEPWAEPGVHPTALVEAGARVDPAARVGAFATVCAGAEVAAGAVVGPYSYVGPGCRVGEGAVLEAHVTLHRNTRLGPKSRVLSGAVLGAVGFGFQDGQRLPHTGGVVVEEGAEIGAGTILERSLVGDTVVGAYSKIGGRCYIAHNVRIGRGVVMVGFSGIAGSVVVEDGVVMGGDVVVSDHVRIGRGARVAGGSGISKDVPPGETWAGGIPSKPLREHWRRLALLDWLAGMEKKLRRVLRESDD